MGAFFGRQRQAGWGFPPVPVVGGGEEGFFWGDRERLVFLESRGRMILMYFCVKKKGRACGGFVE